MLSTWGGNNGMDTIPQVELDCVGFDTCAKYCKNYCWHYGMGIVVTVPTIKSAQKDVMQKVRIRNDRD